jgi:hypothetical protein
MRNHNSYKPDLPISRRTRLFGLGLFTVEAVIGALQIKGEISGLGVVEYSFVTLIAGQLTVIPSLYIHYAKVGHQGKIQSDTN